MGNGGSRVNSTAVGVIVGFALLAVLFSIGIIQFCCKYKCKNCKKSWKKCCKRKKPTLKEKIMSKVSTKKSPPPPFSISSGVK